MASIRKDQRSGNYMICFRFQGRHYQRSLRTSNLKSAKGTLARTEETIQLITTGRMVVPSEVDPGEFILSDGRVINTQQEQPPIRLGEMFGTYFESLPNMAKEESTLSGEHLHVKHLLRHLGKSRIVQSIGLTDIQSYVNRRSQDTYR